jgi:hypothetical protein
MGAWGPCSFENDGALDWVAELGPGGLEAIRGALKAVVQAGAHTYIDVDDANFAIAAAEVIAAARGPRPEGLPDDVVGWLEENGGRITTRDVALALKAVARVRASSELQELWAGHGPDNEWDRQVANLLARLAVVAGT